MTDPIITAIANYRAEMARYNALCVDDLSSEECDALADQTYAEPMAILENWDQPAVSRTGALMALEMALEEGREFASSDMLPPMINAALAYFKDAARDEERAAA